MIHIVEPDRAKRLARAIASDLSLYNDERISRAIETDTLFDDLSVEFEEGRHLYCSRVSPELDADADFFWQAVVDTIVASRGHIVSTMW